MYKNSHIGCAPLISVVMPVFNPNPEYFRKAVESIRSQQLSDWELIIIEDPSEQPATETLRAVSDSRICHIVNSRRTNQNDQRNLGLKEARGQFIAFMDADDIACPFRLVKQINFLRHRPDIHIVGTQITVIDSEDRLVGYRWFPALHEDILHAARRIVPLCHPAVMMRREVFDSFGGYQFNEFPCAAEYEYWSRLLQIGVRFANIPEPLLYYRIHDAQIKSSKLREVILAVLRIKELYWSQSLDLSSRIQRWGERFLLHLPPQLVWWMLLKIRYHYRLDAATPRIGTPIVSKPMIGGDS